MNYNEFFKTATGYSPLPYQARLAGEDWPEILDIPTGLGKTAAIMAAYLYRRLTRPATTARRLVLCLPMRVLVFQTGSALDAWLENLAPVFHQAGQPLPTAHRMLGGDIDEAWAQSPELPAIIVGTQDLLLSRALNRGYAMSRYQWPAHCGLLNSDCWWVLDETQLLGVGVETSAQLGALRKELGAAGPIHTLWMSATVGQDQLDTVDHPAPATGFSTLRLESEDLEHELVTRRVRASKRVAQLDDLYLKKDADPKQARALAQAVLQRHQPGTRTIVVLNRVIRAQQLYQALLKAKADRSHENTALIHSRFRRVDRERQERALGEDGDWIIVATQAIEAGVDVSARTMISELAPWPSLVQRFGRCNRYGDDEEAAIYWIDLDEAKCALPYDANEIDCARRLISELKEASPARLREIAYTPPRVVRPVIRRKDLLDLFDTTPDLSGNDVDVSRYVRDTDDIDVRFYWREVDQQPSGDLPAPGRDELCAVTLPAARKFLDSLDKKEKTLAWRWDSLDGRWWPARSREMIPGQRILLHPDAGGYDEQLGWTGLAKKPTATVGITPPDDRAAEGRSYDGDQATDVGKWLTLEQHLKHVHLEASALIETLGVAGEERAALLRAAAWHDVGKSHETFQQMLAGPGKTEPELAVPDESELWAKSNHNKGKPKRKRFRHELGSALRLLATVEAAEVDLAAYLVAAHHGKVRLSIRALPGESKPLDPETLFARGWWDGDMIPHRGSLALLDGNTLQPSTISLAPMRLGQGSWLERMLALRERLGSFRLLYLEALMRTADGRASGRERQGYYDAK